MVTKLRLYIPTFVYEIKSIFAATKLRFIVQFLAYILVYPFLWLISILPFPILYFFSDLLYFIVYGLIGYRKKVVKSNLELVFPEKSEAEIKTIMKGFYHHLCDMILETIKSMTISKNEMRKRMRFENIEVMQTIAEEGQSIALMCGHYGSWEWLMIMQEHFTNHKGYVIYKRLANPYFDRLVKRIRAKYDSYLITTKEAVPTISLAKTKGEHIIGGFAADQSPKANKAYHWNSFMGINVPMYTGAEMLSKKFNLAVVFCGVKKIKRGYYSTHFQLITKEPSTLPNYQITDKFMELVENQIKEDPQYYLWTHKRWKHKDRIPTKMTK
ncbi:lysophospholipid acyltransferase family protein [Aegicerativicinus sediminis]